MRLDWLFLPLEKPCVHIYIIIIMITNFKLFNGKWRWLGNGLSNCWKNLRVPGRNRTHNLRDAGRQGCYFRHTSPAAFKATFSFIYAFKEDNHNRYQHRSRKGMLAWVAFWRGGKPEHQEKKSLEVWLGSNEILLTQCRRGGRGGSWSLRPPDFPGSTARGFHQMVTRPVINLVTSVQAVLKCSEHIIINAIKTQL